VNLEFQKVGPSLLRLPAELNFEYEFINFSVDNFSEFLNGPWCDTAPVEEEQRNVETVNVVLATLLFLL